MPTKFNPFTSNFDLVGVEGPTSSTDNAVTRFDGTSGNKVQNSTVTIDDAGVINTPSITASRALESDGSKNIVSSTVTSTELGYVSGVNSSIQTQLNAKEPSITVLPIAKGGTNSGTALSNNRVIQSLSGAIVEAAAITASRAVVSDVNGIPTHSTTTSTEIGFVQGVTSSIQTQLNAKEPTITVLPVSKGGTNSGTALSNNRVMQSNAGAVVESAAITSARALISDANGIPTHSTVTSTELDYLISTRSNIQTQIDTYQNYVTNPNFEVNDTGWNRYADAAAAIPVDGTGGSPVVTFARTTTTPLNGVGSGLLTKDAANRQGEGVSTDITIANADKAQVLMVSFNYEIPSGTYADGDIRVYIYDVINDQVIDVTQRDLASTSITGRYIGSFQTNSNSTSYRLILHIASTSAIAYTLEIDEVMVYSRPIIKGPIVTDWQSYTPTFTGFGTVTVQSFQYRKNGSNVELRGRCTLGTPTAVEARVSFPPGLLSTSNMSALEIVGKAARNVNVAADYTVLSEPNVGYVTFGSASSGSSGLVKQTATSFLAVGDLFSFFSSTPIAGWSSNVVLSEDSGNRLIALTASGNAGTALTSDVTNIPFTTTSYDLTSSWDGTTFTVPETGTYKVTGCIRLTATAATRIYSWVNAVKTKAGNSGVTNNVQSFTIEERYVKGQLITFRSDTSATLQNSTTDHWISISKIATPQTLAGSEVVAVRAISTTGQSIPNNTVTTVTWNSAKSYDTHNALDTSTGSFTAPASGLYNVRASLLTGTVSWTATTHTFTIELHKNGALYSRVWVPIQSSVTNAFNSMINDQVSLVRGDTLAIRVTISRGAATVLSSNDNWNFVSIEKVN